VVGLITYDGVVGARELSHFVESPCVGFFTRMLVYYVPTGFRQTPIFRWIGERPGWVEL
jgi:hypothetical protein